MQERLSEILLVVLNENTQLTKIICFIATLFNLEGFPSGQRGRTVNPLSSISKVQILLPPPLYGGVA